MSITQCLDCHKGDEPSLTNVLPLSHSHLLNGISCTACHGDADPPQFVGTGQCLTCHKPGDLIDATKDVEEANPHNSHYGPELDCDLCHHAHRESENFCNQCHDFNFVVPSPHAEPVRTAVAVDMFDCQTCHIEPEYNEEFNKSAHGILVCTSCHSGIDDMGLHMSKEKKPILRECSSCHMDIAVQYETNVHAVKEGLDCFSCHTNVHVRVTEEGVTKSAIINGCTECHEESRYVSDGHGQAVLKGNEDAASCADCHGLHDTPFYDRETEEGRV